VESGYLKAQLVASHAARRARIESGADKIVGVNCFETTEPSPLTADLDAAVQRVDPASESAVLADLEQWRKQRDESAALAALGQLRADAAQPGVNLMLATLACARAGVTSGEWASALREVFGEYRAPTGVGGTPVTAPAGPGTELAVVRAAVAATAAELGVGRLRLLVGKPGLDGHSNGAEQIAVRARDAGFEVIYQGIRLTPEQIVAAAVAEDVHCLGLSILSGGHLELVPEVVRRLRGAGAADLPVVVGGIIPAADARSLRAMGVAAVFTPKDYGITAIIGRIVDEIRLAHKLQPWPGPPL
jgi:(2R)-ethylmalonyl-CoA mutase